MIPLTHEEGQQLVRFARYSVERIFGDRGHRPLHSVRPNMQAGVFVSIHYTSSGENALRGCVGFPLPRGELYPSLEEAAVAAATQDPRFRPISEEELGRVIFEVSVLNSPELIDVAKPVDYLGKVKIGADGLMLSWGDYSSLLLPQVAIEYNWTVDQYLRNLCYKAGLTPDMWMNPDVKIFKFNCAIYRESNPRGEILRIGDQTFE
jgi:uncharacterized protein (TIGR00296 family)